MTTDTDRIEKILWILAAAMWCPGDWRMLIPVAALLMEAWRFRRERNRPEGEQ